MPGKRILVVEDEPLVAQDIRLKLEEAGYAISGTCARGEDAILLAEKRNPDLVLMDIVLAGDMDGIEAAAHIRKQFAIPVVYLTAHADDQRIEQAKVTDPSGYVVKPTSTRELHAVITLALYRAETMRKLEIAAWTSAALQSICDALVTLDSEGIITALNPAAEALFRVTEADAQGQAINALASLTQRVDGATLNDLIGAATAAGSSFSCEKDSFFTLHDGAQVPVHFSVSPIRDPAGKVLGAVLVAHEESERRAIAQALLASKQQLEAVLDNTNAVIYVKDRDGRYLLANRQYERITGIPQAEFPDKTDFDLFPAEIARQLQANDRQVLQQRHPIVYEEHVVQQDGPRDYISAKVPMFDAEGEGHSLCGISTDITDQRRRQRGYQIINQSMQKMVNRLSREPVDAQGFYADITDSIRKLVEADIGALPILDTGGKQFTYRAATGQHAELVEGQSMAVEGGGLCSWVAQHREALCVPELSKDARVIPELARALEVNWALVVPLIRQERVEGGLTAFRRERPFDALDLELLTFFSRCVGIAMDNLQLLQSLEQRVVERTEQLSASNAELQSFSYSVSHDLRAPLRSIAGFSAILLQEYSAQLDAEALDYLHRVDKASARMNELIDDLLALSRVTRSEMQLENVNLSAMVSDIMQKMCNAEPDRKIELSVSPNLRVNGDSGLLRVALENLLGNAWKFTRKRPLVRIEFGAQQQQDGPVYFVRDNGVGFDMNYVEKLFGAFQRLHSGNEYEGTGIGLATVQRVIRRHHGTIWAESNLERGTTFYFKLNAGAPHLSAAG